MKTATLKQFVKEIQKEFTEMNLDYLDFAADRFIEQNADQFRTPAVSLPSEEEIAIKFPCEMGQNVIMEENRTYRETIQANYFRKEGARWMCDKIKANNHSHNEAIQPNVDERPNCVVCGKKVDDKDFTYDDEGIVVHRQCKEYS